MTILKVKYCRNGSGTSQPFVSVLCEDKRTSMEWEKGVCGHQFLVTFYTDEKGGMIWDTIRVSNMKNFELNFHGDHFARFLSCELPKYCLQLGLMECSWSAAAFPKQYKSDLKQVTQ